jgi:hypothetical protein
MLGLLKRFLFGESGEAVVWIVVTIIGIIIAVAAFLKFKSSPGNVGNEVSGAANNAAEGLKDVRIQ